ncbi:outer membrane beta-barrel protein [Legionella pneumophila]|uniref:outer membrane beta-barrel protein n=1 Tax=Legionella pneumophila TaxID=446 RepID=UPI0013752EED|nr:outer membrane beta-barrel protein [Legionella pneumophila]HAT8817046.1 outer membrane beta-barrel protein [Legionella pneumophila subsp. pneumophila]MCZ4804850.1 outer membrane beta-barrel protein [Legionella pneumophila]MDW9181106.1 outer membrane beta-barrel protein [Legionella pneumophila]HAT1825514.1 porin family protein [Legionella pneumophila]HAT1866030.1 porin family protein [Legionella pneumophila]
MNRYSIFFLVFCTLSLESHANLYSGINLGINAVKINKDLVYPLEDPVPTTSSFNSAYTDFHGQLIAGYDFSLTSKISAAVEANIDLFTGKAKHRITEWYFNEDVYAEEQLKVGYSLFLLPTYHLNDMVQFFVGPGVSSSRFNIAYSNTAGNVGVSDSLNEWLTGISIKAGSITKLTRNIDLLLTYQFTQYNSVTGVQMEPLSEDTLRGSYKPNVNTVLIGFKVHPSDEITKDN